LPVGSGSRTRLSPECGDSDAAGAESNQKAIVRGNVEGFTLVLMIAWLVLLATFGAMYFMDQATKKRAEKQTGEAPPRGGRSG
jgi:hypothetical protein